MALVHIVKALEAQIGNSTRKLILVKLGDNANDDGVCWPSYKAISEAAECSERSVIRHISELEKSGYLRVTRRAKNGLKTSNLYTLTIEKGRCDKESYRSDTVTIQCDNDGMGSTDTVSHKPPIKNHPEPPNTPNSPQGGGCSGVFVDDVMAVKDAIEVIYQAYPRKVGHGNAVRAIQKALTKIDAHGLLTAVFQYAQAVDGHPDMTKIPHPATWFNQERWLDDPAEWSAWRNSLQSQKQTDQRSVFETSGIRP